MYRLISTTMEARLCCISRTAYKRSNPSAVDRRRQGGTSPSICTPLNSLEKFGLSSSSAVPGTSKPMGDFVDRQLSPLRCLWLTRIDPLPLDAGDLTYTFHLLSSLSRAGAQLTVLAMRRSGDRTRSP